MYRKLTAVLVTLFVLVFALPVHADNTVSADLTWPVPVASGEIGFTSVEDFSNDFRAFSRIFAISAGEIICSSFEDPYCLAHSKPESFRLSQVLLPCVSVQEKNDCIDGLTLSDGVSKKDSTLFKSLPYSHFTADKTRGVPEGGSPSLWSNPFNSDPSSGFVVVISGLMSSRGGKYQLENFAASVKSYRTMLGNYQPLTIVPAGPTSNDGRARNLSWVGSSPGCVWTDAGVCGVQTDFPGIKTITLKVRISNTQTGWLAGRLVNPNIKVEPISSNQNLLTVTAEPARYAVVSAHVPSSSTTPEMQKFNLLGDEFRSFGIKDLSELLTIYKSATQDRATKILPGWSFTNGYGQSTNPCLQSRDGFVGMVTTNSLAYQTDAPVFSDGTLNYSLASPHFQPNGDPFEGTYDLVINSSAARCLYKYSSAPVTAAVSITNDGATIQVASNTLQESDGWLRLDVKGFHFSDPTIKVSLQQAKSASAPLPTNSQPRMGAKNVSITCIKGNQKRVITNIRPLCPTGWAKAAN